MAEHSRAVHKLEKAVDMVNDVNRMEREAIEDQQFGPQTGNIRITPVQVRDLMNSFGVFDRNNDRGLDIDELASVFRACGQNPTRKQLQAIADEADADGNGRLEQNEYITLLMSHMQSPAEVEEEMRDAFAVFDRDGDGRVDKKELMKVLQMCDNPMTPDEADELMTLMDTNEDGYIDIDEFSSFLCNGAAMKDVERRKREASASNHDV